MDDNIKKAYLLFLENNGIVSEVRDTKSFFHNIKSYTAHARDKKGWKRVRLAVSDIKVAVSEEGVADPILALYESFLEDKGKVRDTKKIEKSNGEITQHMVIGKDQYPIIFRVHRLNYGCFITADYIGN